MSIDEKFRSWGFAGYDLLKGRVISKNMADLDSYHQDPVKYSKIAEEKLKKLLAHACRTVPFYKKYKGGSSLSDFPVVQKDMINSERNLFFSDLFDRSRLAIVKTSGSYGTPMVFYHDPGKQARRFAEVVYFNRWAGYEIGMRHAFIRTNEKSQLKLLAENEMLIFPFNMDSEWLDKQWQRLLAFRPHCIIGYPSVLAALAIFYRDGLAERVPLNIKGIISFAEPLLEDQRSIIKDVFECPVVSRYSAEELGVLAHECAAGGKYHLNLANYYIELLSLDGDLPVNAGELGRIVVTDLHALAMPLIRYDTGDIAVSGEGCPCGLNTTVFKNIEGRKTELLYDTRGRAVSPLAVTGRAGRTIPGIRQFQFIQRGEKYYIVRLTVFDSFQTEKCGLIVEKLKEVLGEDAVIEFEFVSNIEPLLSGKRPYIINEYASRASNKKGV